MPLLLNTVQIGVLTENKNGKKIKNLRNKENEGPAHL
jgi:hypothetical protein